MAASQNTPRDTKRDTALDTARDSGLSRPTDPTHETQPDTQQGPLSLADVGRLFISRPSPRVLILGLLVTATLRLVVADGLSWQVWDLAAVLLVVVLAPVFEWFIHLWILHLPARRLGPVLLDPGAGHRQHHLRPTDMDWVLLRAREAGLFQLANGVIVALLLGPMLWLSGALAPEPILTGVFVAVVALTHYEWSHFLFHTSYRPKTRYYRRLKRNHRLHHWRNERYWLGITSNAADRLFRTYPASRSSVPLSPTAKDLSGSDGPGVSGDGHNNPAC